MEYQTVIYYLCCFCLHLVVCQNISGPGLCMKPNSASVSCCTNFYLNENECLACKPGYRGVNCQEICPHGYFGQLCQEQCDCSLDMYCEPTRGCLCNTTSVNCTDPAQVVTVAITNDVKVTQEKHSDFLINVIAILSSLFGIVCLVVGSVCIRARSIKVQKKRKDTRTDILTVEERRVATSDNYNHLNLRAQCPNRSLYYSNMPITCGDHVPCPSRTLAINSRLKEESNHINLNPFDTARISNKKKFGKNFENNTQTTKINDQTTEKEKYINSTSVIYPSRKQVKKSNKRQEKFCDGTAKAKLQETVNNADIFETNSNDDEFYVNCDDIGYANSWFRPRAESPSGSEESHVYFDVSYEGHLTMCPTTDNTSCLQSSFISVTDPEIADYINCGSIFR